MKVDEVLIIGSGFSGLSAACFMAKAGWKVTVLEKHDLPGGRARKFEVEGFKFDMGPSWYWMPDVFERFFNQFGKSVSDYYALKRLDPSYRVYWKSDYSDIPADYEELKKLFESLEKGSSENLDKFLAEAAFKYNTSMQKLVFKPGMSITEFLDWDVARGLLRLDILSSMKTHVAAYFKSEKLRELMEFPVLFLGALPKDTPALYSLMNYADIKGGTWFPEGGMYSIVEAMYDLAIELGVEFHFKQEVKSIIIKNGKAIGVTTSTGDFRADVIIGSADYHHIETALLPEECRTYSSKYWESRVMAPGCLLYYVGINKKLKNITHHTLFFDVPFEVHSKEIYTEKQWPTEPLFYVSATSVSDESLAPQGCENLFFLIPVATGLEGDTEELRKRYFDLIVKRFEERTGESISDSIVYYRSFAQSDFISEYHSFKGNAYGLANTLRQTAVLKPAIKSSKVENLYYTGQLTVPGPGVPPSLISGEVVSSVILKEHRNK